MSKSDKSSTVIKAGINPAINEAEEIQTGILWPTHLEVTPLDWDPREGVGKNWRKKGWNLRERAESAQLGQIRTIEVDWNPDTGHILFAIGKRGAQDVLDRARFYALDIKQIAQILFDFDAARQVVRYQPKRSITRRS